MEGQGRLVPSSRPEPRAGSADGEPAPKLEAAPAPSLLQGGTTEPGPAWSGGQQVEVEDPDLDLLARRHSLAIG